MTRRRAPPQPRGRAQPRAHPGRAAAPAAARRACCWRSPAAPASMPRTSRAGLPGWRGSPATSMRASLPSIARLVRRAARNVLRAAACWTCWRRTWPGVPAQVDAVYCANMLHIAPWACLRGADARRGTPPGAARPAAASTGRTSRTTCPPSPGNLAFDADLRARNPAWGLRRLADVAARGAGRRPARCASAWRCRPTTCCWCWAAARGVSASGTCTATRRELLAQVQRPARRRAGSARRVRAALPASAHAVRTDARAVRLRQRAEGAATCAARRRWPRWPTTRGCTACSNALGTHTAVSRVQGGRLKAKREIRIASAVQGRAGATSCA